MTSWDILICTIPHRHWKLLVLLEILDQQMMPGAAVRLYRDNTELPVGVKRQRLLESSNADYVSFVDDDDMVPGDYVPRIMDALGRRPDYVGFPVRISEDGVPQPMAQHSLRHPGWRTVEHGTGGLLRDISHLNPIRRELALLGDFDIAGSDRYAEDYQWARQVRESGRVKTEEWIDEPMYFYRHSKADESQTPRVPFLAENILPIPGYPWLTLHPWVPLDVAAYLAP